MAVKAADPRPMTWYNRFLVALVRSRPGAWLVVHVVTHVDRWLLRVTRGRLSTARGSSLGGHVVLLTTTGAKSGRLCRVPLLAVLEGDDLVLIASKGGHPRHPGWYHNLRAHPGAEVLVRGRTIRCVAREAEGDERDRLWQRAVALYPGYATYQARTGRRIPVLVLSPAAT